MNDNCAMRVSAGNGHLEIASWLLECGLTTADIRESGGLQFASANNEKAIAWIESKLARQ